MKKDNLIITLSNIEKATQAYIEYIQTEQENWDDKEKDIAHATLGTLTLFTGEVLEAINHFDEIQDNDKVLQSYIDYIDVFTNHLLKSLKE